jgi:hypothetical protein
MLRGTAGWRGEGNDDINLETYEFGSHGGELVYRSVRPPRLKDDVLSLDIAEFRKRPASKATRTSGFSKEPLTRRPTRAILGVG